VYYFVHSSAVSLSMTRANLLPGVAAAGVIATLGFGLGATARETGPNDVLPEEPAKALVVRACTGCHQAPQIVAKRLSPDDWDVMIGKMIDRGAPLTEDEADRVYAYLVKHFAAAPPASEAPPAPASPGG
jgi:hypothetical protein